MRLRDFIFRASPLPADGPVLNLMLGRKRGGLEQAAIDYAEALAHAGIGALTITSPGAHITPELEAIKAPHIALPNAGGWDPCAAQRLRRIAQQQRARAVICHGNRALRIARRALGGRIPVIAVAHNYRTKRFASADAIFCITTHARDTLAESGIAKKKLLLMPNMVRLPLALPERRRHTPPVIGTLGRFIARKGFQDWIAALALLKHHGVDFRAVLGGDGEDKPLLEQLVAEHGLEDRFEFLGWVKNDENFYGSIDLFVMPSRHEPFGIVLIESMAYGVPVVTTLVEGPRDIVTDEKHALTVPPQDPAAMAEAMARLLAEPALAARLAKAARTRVAQEYTIGAMADRLKTALTRLTSPL